MVRNDMECVIICFFCGLMMVWFFLVVVVCWVILATLTVIEVGKCKGAARTLQRGKKLFRFCPTTCTSITMFVLAAWKRIMRDFSKKTTRLVSDKEIAYEEWTSQDLHIASYENTELGPHQKSSIVPTCNLLLPVDQNLQISWMNWFTFPDSEFLIVVLTPAIRPLKTCLGADRF